MLQQIIARVSTAAATACDGHLRQHLLNKKSEAPKKLKGARATDSAFDHGDNNKANYKVEPLSFCGRHDDACLTSEGDGVKKWFGDTFVWSFRH